MKAIIPVAGAGTKLRPLTYTQPKPLIPVGGKPILAFIIDQLRAAGVEEFVFVIGYLGDKIKDYVESSYPKLIKDFVFQHSRQGLGHAIWTAREFLPDDEEIVVVLGDTIVDTDMKAFVQTDNSCLAIKKVEDPRQFGVVEFDANGYVSKVVEKPTIPKSNMAMVGLYKFGVARDLIHSIQYNIDNELRTHGEFQLTDAIMRMIATGSKFNTMEVHNWYDCGKKEVLLETNAILLDRYNFYRSTDYAFDNTIIIPPVAIGEECRISNSIIGPHVTIGNHASIEYSIVKESIIGNYASIEEVVLHQSVVGNDAAIKGLRQSLNLGDNTEIDFS